MIVLPPIRWVGSPNYSTRGGQKTRLLVGHDCEGNYPGSVSWFAQARSQVSAHLVLQEDGAAATQMVAWGNKAWHVCNFNPFSEGIEAAGYAAKGLMGAEWDALAALIAWRLHANDIPCQYASANNNWTGFCQHVDLGAAGGGHHDISSDPARRTALTQLVLSAYEQGPPTDPRLLVPTSPPIAPAGFTPSGTTRHDLVSGSIEWAQATLNAMGMARPLLTVDGLDGPATKRAVSAFQGVHGLFMDGILGSQTIQAMGDTPKRALGGPQGPHK